LAFIIKDSSVSTRRKIECFSKVIRE